MPGAAPLLARSLPDGAVGVPPGPADLERLRELLAGAPDQRPAPSERREAAVLVPLFVEEGEIRVVLTKKSERLRRHAGEVAFPGGVWEGGDTSLLETALREASEEAGIAPQDVDVLGPLPDLPTASTGFLIRPYAAIIPWPYELRPDGFETERIFTPPLSVFADPARARAESWHGYAVHFFDDVDGELVWGATARILLSLLSLLD